MKIIKVGIKNFRLLKDVELCFESDTTVIVGRNNSGKTSLAELFRRLLSSKDGGVNFALEDFSLSVHEQFWAAYQAYQAKAEEVDIRAKLPVIETTITMSYDKSAGLLGPLADFIVDLNPDCTDVRAVIKYQLPSGGLRALFDNIELKGETGADKKNAFFKVARERIPKQYSASLVAVDPNDSTNIKPLEWSRFKAVLQTGFIHAHRGLDDVTHHDNDVLGKILEVLFKAAQSDTASDADKNTAQGLKSAVETVQGTIAKDFSTELKKLLPAFQLFGYPRLKDPGLCTETAFDVERLLKDHTKIRYSGINGVNLPEAYNGLGTRNLIFILLKLLGFFKEFQSGQSTPAVHLVFIEEPEAHLHPQMQEVFISKLSEIALEFANVYNGGKPWPVQFVVTTHSSHLANKAPFRAMRYFLATSDSAGALQTRAKDLGEGFSKSLKPDDDFIHKYMTLTRCDLLFADKAIIIEGTTERILMPKMIAEVDKGLSRDDQLSSQYICVMEVGGAYAHRFFKLLDFLELRSLVITDLDSVQYVQIPTKKDPSKTRKTLKACKVSVGTQSSNACIKEWLAPKSTDAAESPAVLSIQAILAKMDSEKITGCRRLAFQIAESKDAPVGRSFEAAFMLANRTLFNLTEVDDLDDLEESVWDESDDVDSKSDFAIKYAIEKEGWVVPRYIHEGLAWLAEIKPIIVSHTAASTPATSSEPAANTTANV